MARLIDRDGVPLNPQTLRTIEYCVYEIDTVRKDVRRPVMGHDHIVLNVGQVICNALRTGSTWAVDEIGYNFYHSFRLRNAFSAADKQYEVRYWLTLISGDKTVICFRLRVN
ncbi:MAG TPA: hypothetical protein VFW73_13460 [Lacipirellulaceae bacterium]|nr:hypothetical protein [Lacipirellulaceae bacterium]